MKFWAKKRYIKYLTAHLLYITGLLSLWSKIKLRNKAIILMYHRVLSKKEILENYSQDGIVVKCETFEKHMKYIKNNFKILSLLEFIEHFQKRIPFETKSCLITFDDGWKDNFQNAYPLLKEIGIPAVIFLTTDFVGTKEQFWQERVMELLLGLYDAAGSDSNVTTRLMREFPDTDIESILKCERGSLKDGISGYISFLKGKSKEEIEKITQRLADLTGKWDSGKTTEEAFMDWDEIRIMTKNRISFGSHGKSHAILTRLQKREIEKEALESKERIEEKLGTSICAFSYPNGDYSEQVLDIVRNAGYRLAFSTESGTHSAADNPYKIRRINIHGDMTNSIPMFLARVAGLW